MKQITIIRSLVFGLLLALCFKTQAQQVKDANDEKAVQLLDKAIGDVFFTDNYAVYFEGIAFGVKNPEDIFTLPVYEVYRGGHLFVDKDNYELQGGFMKSLCDGKLMVVVEEQSKTMFIDSVDTDMADDSINDPYDTPEFNEVMKDYFTEGTLKYEGIVTINKHKCHKIRSDIKNNKGGTHVLYWVDVKTGMLYLMADYQDNGYCVYWIDKVGKAPAKNSYTIYLPAKLLTDFHGYTVIDNRFDVKD
jgi:hypothetical protein